MPVPGVSPEAGASGILARFDLSGQVALVTGGAGLLGLRHAEALLSVGGTVVIGDLRKDAADDAARRLSEMHPGRISGLELDVTNAEACQAAVTTILERHGRADILINNAARNPKVERDDLSRSRFERATLADWQADLDVGLTGAFLCSQAFGRHFMHARRGVILNIASDL
jgi:NAD(P)-dependent dehydrogenase (short-subunit alcohol dehydrogenase family)